MKAKTQPTPIKATLDHRSRRWVVIIGQHRYTGDTAQEAEATAQSGRGYQIELNGNGHQNGHHS
jgi:hypothetical protein